MRKTISIIVICALLIASLVLWALKGKMAGSLKEILQAMIVFILVGFALFLGFSRIRGRLRGEPAEDELSRRVTTKASSLSYYVSIYLWLFVMYMSDRTSLPTHALIGAGIMGMALVFLFSWLYVRAAGMRNE